MVKTSTREELERELREILRRNREAFKGKYKREINDLLSISRAEIDAITPGTTDLEIYDLLIEVVKEASRRNLAQAELKDRIELLGEIAIKIAKYIPSLAVLFA
jgi:hypothetical protein